MMSCLHLMLQGYFTTPSNPLKILNVESQVVLNNLVEVDSAQNLVTINLFFRLYWTDPRLALPSSLWGMLNSSYSLWGLDLSQVLGIPAVASANNDVPQIWYPDVFFPDATTIETGASLSSCSAVMRTTCDTALSTAARPQVTLWCACSRVGLLNGRGS